MNWQDRLSRLIHRERKRFVGWCGIKSWRLFKLIILLKRARTSWYLVLFSLFILCSFITRHELSVVDFFSRSLLDRFLTLLDHFCLFSPFERISFPLELTLEIFILFLLTSLFSFFLTFLFLHLDPQFFLVGCPLLCSLILFRTFLRSDVRSATSTLVKWF